MTYVTPAGRVVSSGDFLDAPVHELMSPGVIAISEHASLNQVYTALVTYRVHAIVVADAKQGTPLGWATAERLVEFAEKDTGLLSARDAITHEAHTIESGAAARDAIREIAREEITHLIVIDREDGFPVGTISALDLAAFLAPET